MDHEKYMQLAIQEAIKARRKGEVPVGAVLVNADGGILAAAYNQPISLSDPTAHAEILALRHAAAQLKNYRLLSTRLYVTVEPCAMCMGAIIHARVAMLVYGTEDPKWGAAGSLYDFSKDQRFNHQVQVIGGTCRLTCRKLMQDFFQEKRRS